MNSSLLVRFTRLAAATATKRSAVLAPMALRASAMLSTASSASSTENKKKKRDTNFGVPPEDYYDGHLMTDHLEFLEDMIEKTSQLEQSVESLRASHNELVQNVKWMDGQDIDDLLEPTRQQKESIAKQIAHLKMRMEEAKKTYAVDAPDGEADWHVKEEMAEIQHIIEDAAVLENAQEILRQRAADKKVFAVDAPDESDWHIKEELKEIKHIIDDAAAVEDTEAILRERSVDKKIFAVDSPDGIPDGRVKEELAEIRHIIDDAAVLEDKDKIKYKQMVDANIRKDRARDPEHDW